MGVYKLWLEESSLGDWIWVDDCNNFFDILDSEAIINWKDTYTIHSLKQKAINDGRNFIVLGKDGSTLDG